MYTEQEYLYGWLIYLGGALLLAICFWVLTSAIRFRALKIVLRLGAIAFFATPWFASEQAEYLAPAWVIAAFEGIFDGPEAFWRAGAPLLSVTALVMGLSAVILTILHFRRRPTETASPT